MIMNVLFSNFNRLMVGIVLFSDPPIPGVELQLHTTRSTAMPFSDNRDNNDSSTDGAKNLLWQYKLLMWKNFVLLRRSPFRIFVEIFWPLALFIILMAVRSRQSLVTRKHECHFHNKPMPSAGLLPFFQVSDYLAHPLCKGYELVGIGCFGINEWVGF